MLSSMGPMCFVGSRLTIPAMPHIGALYFELCAWLFEADAECGSAAVIVPQQP
jgi:hypothetical protein